MISIIAAVAENGIIGANNKMPWELPEDLARFKSITMGHTIIMGRKTFESLGKPLPGRNNIVISGSKSMKNEGVTVVSSLPEALSASNDDKEVFIIGGGSIYSQTIDIADKLYITLIKATVEGDAFFPDIDMTKWEIEFTEDHDNFCYINYTRKPK